MRLLKKVSLILYVLMFLLNDPQLIKACVFDGIEVMSSGYALYPGDIQLITSYGNLAGKYRILYHINDGSGMIFAEVVEQAQLPYSLPVPEREGYNFAGWYKDSAYRQRVTEIPAEDPHSLVLYAKWTDRIDNHYNVENYSYRTAAANSGELELKSCSYRFLDEVDIPGMPFTRVQDYFETIINSESQCLQGLAFTPEFILISAYAEESEKEGALMIFDRNTGRYLLTFAMKQNSHLGGIAFDGDNVWICHTEDYAVERIPYECVLAAVAEGNTGYCDMSAVSVEYPLINEPCCISCYDGRIWVATHTTLLESEMVAYSYQPETDLLVVDESYRIPSKVQGVGFDDNGAVYLSTSYGRRNSSYLMLYHSLEEMDKDPKTPAMKVEMPPCSEELVIYQDNIYLLFESASMKYFEGTDGNGISTAPIDKILEINISSIW